MVATAQTILLDRERKKRRNVALDWKPTGLTVKELSAMSCNGRFVECLEMTPEASPGNTKFETVVPSCHSVLTVAGCPRLSHTGSPAFHPGTPKLPYSLSSR